ncbi:MAG TPA: C4-type zinc ribbon domain-containing protein [Acidimicrobiales bacterium]|jgi:hypothetical protein|nr:C4-type zinc ribbon domain-containing protein [Acidimicrobiales bacterium]
MTPLATLLDLQDHDTAADQQRHKRASLPERAELVEIERARATLEAESAGVAAERAELAREQRRLEDEVAAVESKASSEDTRLYSGTITSPKELQTLQEEIASLKRRQGVLEDRVLELMEQGEPLDEQLAGFASRRATLDARAADVRSRLASAETEIDADLARLASERALLASGVAAGVLAEYEQLRTRLGGVAAAKLEGGSCRGCHLHLAAVELDRIRKLPADAIVHCEECGRILVR